MTGVFNRAREVQFLFACEGEVSPQMFMVDVPESEYIIFKNSSFNYDHENHSVEEKIENAITTFYFTNAGCFFDSLPGKIM